MSAFRRFVGMMSPPDTGRAFPADPFVQFDRDQAIKKLRLEQRAIQNGGRNYPPVDSPDLDDVEQEIVAEAQQIAARSQSEAASNHKVYGQRLAELSLLRELSGITAASQRALGDFGNLVMNVRGRLSEAADQVRESYLELKEFKSEHGLRRPAHEGTRASVAWSIFLMSTLVETALNTLMLKVNDDYGYLGGFLAALVVASVNVGFSAFIGRMLFPYLNHRRIATKLLALAGTGLWIVWAIFWNLLAAQFRDAKAAGLDEPDKQALIVLLQTPFQLDSIYSYGLFVAGLLFSIIAAVTALGMKDPYPGYGDLYKRHEDRCRFYSDEIEDATNELTLIRDEATTDATATRSELGVQFRERGQVIASREFHRGRYRDHQRHLEEVCNGLLSYYRSKNVQARPDGSHPEHFKIPHRLNISELPHSIDEPTTEAEVAKAEKSLSDSIIRIGAAYNDAIHSFTHLDAIKQELRLGS